MGMDQAARTLQSYADEATTASVGSAISQQLRRLQQAMATAHAAQLSLVASVLDECSCALPPRAVASRDRAEFVRGLAIGEVSCTLGISAHAAAGLVDLAQRLRDVMPEVLRALAEGRIDLQRAQVLAERTAVLDADTAADVARGMLGDAGHAPWDGPSPRAWRARVERAVLRADAAAAALRRARAVAARQVAAWSEGDGLGVLQLRADAADVAMVQQVVDDLARAWPSVDADGGQLTVDQRRADAVVGLFRRARDAAVDGVVDGVVDREADLPRLAARRVHDLGLVLHADTLFGDGGRAAALGELRGLGAPVPVDPLSARTIARRQIGTGTAVQVLLVDATGALQQVVRLAGPAAERAAASRSALVSALRGALPHQPATSTTRYQPTAAIARYVHAAAPTCSFYDCPRAAGACDLDHDVPWPRGPSAVTNLDPKCRRHHQAKTAGLAHTVLRAGPGQGQRSVTWMLRGGLRTITRPEPLPGCEPIYDDDGCAA